MPKKRPPSEPFEDDSIISNKDFVLRRGKLSSQTKVIDPDILRNPATGTLTFAVKNFSLSASENSNGYSVNSVQKLRENRVSIIAFVKQPFSTISQSVIKYEFGIGKSKVKTLKKYKMNFRHSIATNDPNISRGESHFIMATNPYPAKEIEIFSRKISQKEHMLECISKFAVFYPKDFKNSYRVKLKARIRELLLTIRFRIKFFLNRFRRFSD